MTSRTRKGATSPEKGRPEAPLGVRLRREAHEGRFSLSPDCGGDNSDCCLCNALNGSSEYLAFWESLGAVLDGDGETWREVIGRNSTPDLNLSGVLSLDVYASHGSAIANAMFEHKVSHKSMFKANLSEVVVRTCDQKVTSACCDPLVDIRGEGNSQAEEGGLLGLFGLGGLLKQWMDTSCTDSHTFVRKTVGVGQSVNLTCTRQASLHGQTLYWIRLVSGKYPEFLGGTFSFDYDGINETPHITAKQEPEAFILYIHETQLSDTGFYYCIKVNEPYMEFMNATFLRIKGPEPDIIDIIQVPPSDPEHPGDSVSLQCSVLSDSEKKTCPEQQDRMFWFRAGSDESHPRLIYADGNSQDECETNPEAQSPQKCIYSFSKTVTSSDAGTYYCAVATCGQILFGNGAKSDNNGPEAMI
ncbi:uncharacterized protein LOC111581249 [Amphiprion ocellaris]|uniref:uncharacterized protein LOC111581249 n=1 Tax=Amphiprion ocellaris TaxID=80972 RepID=UPI0024113D3A|nr:uncharacterized protein LOC111581249 [Amphiprion ocellaris]